MRETQELQTRCAAIETELMHAEVQKENEMALRARLEAEVETLKEEKRVMVSDVQRMQRRQR